MPEMDGFETTALIREREKTTGAHLPIVALTAHAMKGDREHCLDAGMDAYVAKPLNPLALFATLESAVPGGDAPAPDQPPAAASPPARVLDQTKLLGRVGGDVELLDELIGLFLGEYPNQLASARAALAAKDGGRLRAAAHAIKGSVSNFDSATAYEAAVRLEDVGRRSDWAGAEGALAALERALTDLRTALADLRPAAVSRE
jgi:CheY-like chemotaxis protein